jgi:hypothetical protein
MIGGRVQAVLGAAGGTSALPANLNPKWLSIAEHTPAYPLFIR